MKRRVDAAVAPISPSEIVILGGTEAYNLFQNNRVGEDLNDIVVHSPYNKENTKKVGQFQ